MTILKRTILFSTRRAKFAFIASGTGVGTDQRQGLDPLQSQPLEERIGIRLQLGLLYPGGGVGIPAQNDLVAYDGGLLPEGGSGVATMGTVAQHIEFQRNSAGLGLSAETAHLGAVDGLISRVVA